jgi:hypothetical protein
VRLDPRRGVRIDVGDLEQDATFLLEGWSVRHPCGDAVCREVEGRAEMAVPLERAATSSLHVLVVGTGELRVTVNGEVLDTIGVHGEFFDRELPRVAWQRGVNRVVLERLSGRQLIDGLVIGERVDR